MCILRVELSCVCRGILWVVKAHTRSAHLISRLARKLGEGGQYENRYSPAPTQLTAITFNMPPKTHKIEDCITNASKAIDNNLRL